MSKRSILLIGISWDEYDTLVGPEKKADAIKAVKAMLDDGENQLVQAGYDYSFLEYSPTESTARLEQKLAERSWSGVCVGVGIRINKQYTSLFERLVNVVRERSPDSKLLFNSTPSNTLEAAHRAFGEQQ